MKNEIAKTLLKLGCVELSPSQPFQYASGLKGPIYCDNRKVLSHPVEREVVVKGFVTVLKEKGWSFDALAGLATAGIPHAAFMASELKEPMVYVRSKPKSHGRRQQIEGDINAGQSIVLVEDLVNQGASLNEALVGIKEAELHVAGCLSIVHYQMPAAQKVIEDWNLDFEYLTDFDSLCQAALELQMIQESEVTLLKEWQQDPKAWSEKNS